MNTLSRPLIFLLLIGTVIQASPAAAQRAVPAQPPARAQAAIDPLTASIQGRVTSADTGAPIRRAEVRALSERNISRLVTTDAEGRFVLRDMPAGEYRITASKTGFVSLAYGQSRPFEAPEAVVLQQGQKASVTLLLPRAGAIAGRVVDEAGEPLAETRMQALRTRVVEGRRRLQPAGPVDVTDDTGAFRLYGLAPGEYYVSATPRQPAGPQGTRSNVTSTMTTYYPGTVSLEEAQRIAVGVGGEVRADMQLVPMRAAVVSGIVLSSSGTPAADADVDLQSDVVAMGVSAILSGPPPLRIGTHTESDGTFTLPDVPPGAYVLRADISPVVTFTGPAQQGLVLEENVESAAIPIVVGGGDMTGVTVTTSLGGTIEGAILRDPGATEPLPAGLGIEVRSVGPGNHFARLMNRNGGTFRVMGVRGPAHVAVSGLPEGWTVKSMLSDGGVDLIDEPIEARNGRTVTVSIMLTNRVTDVTGTVASTGGGAAGSADRRDHSVVVFAADAAKWRYPSRYVRSVRADQQGAFRITALPGEERYLAVAVNYLEQDEATDPQFLERMRDRATSFTLGDAGRATVALRVVER